MNRNWKTALLGDISDFQGGTQPPKSQFVSEPREGYIRLLQIRDFKSDDKAVYVPISTKLRTCSADDILIGRYGASVGQIHRGKSGAYNVALIRTLPNTELITRDFFYLYLLSDLFQKRLMAVSDRSAQAGFSKKDIAGFQVPLPLITEQQRIVAILDEAFAGIATATANAEKNLQNARELFESTLQAVFAEKGEGWKMVQVKDVASHCLGKMLDKNKNKGEFKPYLRNLNVRWFDFNLDDMLEMRFLLEETDRYTAVKGDLLICEGGYPGRAAIWDKGDPIYFQKAIHRVRFERPEYAQWLLYFLYLSEATGDLRKYFTGAGIQHFTGKALGSLVFPMPPVSVVKEKLGLLERLMEETKTLEGTYKKKLGELAELKQSILQKAFAGELH